MENVIKSIEWSIGGLDSLIATVKTEDGTVRKYKVAEAFEVQTGNVQEPVVETPVTEEPEPVVEPEPIVVPPVNETPEPEPEPVVEPEPAPVNNDYVVWIKDSLWGKDFEISSNEWTWTRPTEHSYDVYIEGPAGTKIYPEIERAGKIYTTKEELTSRGPRIGFNKLQNIPMTLQGLGTKTLIGKGISPGSASAKGYKGVLRFKDENGTIIKEINMQFI